MSQDKGNVTIRLSSETRKKLDGIAAGLSRSRNGLINEAIENYLEVYEWQEKKIRTRLTRAKKKGKFFTGGQVNEVIDSFKK